jgi:transposase
MELVLEGADHGSSKRRYWSIEEKRRIVEDTFCSLASVALLAREHGLNANQLFYWRKQYHAGQLELSTHVGSSSDVRLIPVTVADEGSRQAQGDASTAQGRTGTINIEFPGRALVSVEGSVDAGIVRAVLGTTIPCR